MDLANIWAKVLGLPDIVVGGDLAARHPAVEALLIELDVLEDLDGLVVVSEEGVQAEQPHQREVTQHLVERVAPKVPGHSVGVTLGVVHLQLLVDVGLVHQGVKHIQHGVHIPNLRNRL